MPNRIFYPLVLILMSGMIYLAVWWPWRTIHPPINFEDGITVSETQLEESLFPAPGTSLNMSSDETGTFAVLSAHASWREIKNAGVALALGPDYETAFAGNTLQISITARRGGPKPADTLYAGYFTVQAGDSGWKPFELNDEFQTYTFDFYARANPNQVEPASDYVGVWPDPEGESHTVEVKEISVKILGEGRL